MSDVDDGILVALQAELAELRAQRKVIDERIARCEAAVSALNGDFHRLGGRRSATAGHAILAALSTFKGPVRTEDLLDQEGLGHYSRSTLRGALSELHRSGRLVPVERTPRGYIWEPPR